MAQWKITKDNISTPEETSDVGVHGPSTFKDDIKMPHKFRMLDDDGIIYYYGICSCDSSFAPLDDFGMPNAGATTIEYRNPKTGVYEAL